MQRKVIAWKKQFVLVYSKCSAERTKLLLLWVPIVVKKIDHMPKHQRVRVSQHSPTCLPALLEQLKVVPNHSVLPPHIPLRDTKYPLSFNVTPEDPANSAQYLFTLLTRHQCVLKEVWDIQNWHDSCLLWCSFTEPLSVLEGYGGSMLPSLCHIWWICGCVESFAPVLKRGGLGVRRKGLPQAPAAVWWSVTGSFSQPSGTKTALWSVSISDQPGWRKSAPNIEMLCIDQAHIRNLPLQHPHMLDWIGSLFLCLLADQQLISVAFQPDSLKIFIGRSMPVYFSIVPISFWVTEVLKRI